MSETKKRQSLFSKEEKENIKSFFFGKPFDFNA
jgi:hypothetical protein